MHFEFDHKKAIANLRKHDIAFAEVEPVSYDDFALTREDVDALGEPRFVTVGADSHGRVVAACWTQRDESIRLISARLASPQERKNYES